MQQEIESSTLSNFANIGGGGYCEAWINYVYKNLPLTNKS
jgi:hypothetical protein